MEGTSRLGAREDRFRHPPGKHPTGGDQLRGIHLDEAKSRPIDDVIVDRSHYLRRTGAHLGQGALICLAEKPFALSREVEALPIGCIA